ncbi:MAG: MFS transporter [Pseudomonadota bacterium]
MSRWLTLVTLIVAGEMIFGLPFQTARFFRPTLLEVFGFSNTQLGDLFAAYGVTAMLSYFPGGVLADRFSARRLLTLSLLATAAGGFVMLTLPGAPTMLALYAFWGVTSILLFWGALIRATREWGGHDQQGMAFGLLDAGRGLVAAIVAAIAVQVFAVSLGSGEVTEWSRALAFHNVIAVYVAVNLLVAAMTWLFIPEVRPSGPASPHLWLGIRRVLSRPVIWTQAGVIVAAYCGYKGLDNYSLYLVQVMGYDELRAAELSAYGAYLRPVGALAAGVLADRLMATRVSFALFLLMLLSYAGLVLLTPSATAVSLLFANLAVSYLAVCGMRSVYFALLEQNQTPKAFTGTAVGFISLVGYTPDVFFAPITGRILDASPGAAGHQDYFMFLGGVAVVGLAASALLMHLHRRGRLWPER